MEVPIVRHYKHPGGIVVDTGRMEQEAASRTKAALGGRAGGAKRHCLLLQSEGAIDQSLGSSPRNSAWPTEVRSTQVADPMTAESIDLFCDFANWRPASFHFTRRVCSMTRDLSFWPN